MYLGDRGKSLVGDTLREREKRCWLVEIDMFEIL